MSGESKDAKRTDERKIAREKSKIGHRRINDEGTVTYKKKTTSEIQKALQLGIKVSVTLAHSKSKRDMLLKDFGVVETLSFPKGGGKETPMHDLSDFTFKTFAPIAFRYFRDFFQVDIQDYLNSICHQDLRELSSAGASGSIFYITCDDEFIIKTVQHKEASFLQKLLPEYYINLIQHPRTLLPKFYGLYCYQTMGKNIRFVIMNNLLPSMIRIHEKYDLKGSTYKRVASIEEKSKSAPTLKDLDFRERHPDSLLLEVDTYEALLNTIQRDCRVLESFRIMDYSLLLGVHNLDENLRATAQARRDHRPNSHTAPSPVATAATAVAAQTGALDQLAPLPPQETPRPGSLQSSQTRSDSSPTAHSGDQYFTPCGAPPVASASEECDETGDLKLSTRSHDNQSHNTITKQQGTVARVASSPGDTAGNVAVAASGFSRHKTRSRSTRRIAAYSTVLESIHAPVEQVELQSGDEESVPTGGIPARNKGGDRLILYMGVIDILQSYQLVKKMEHNLKAVFLDASTISVTDPKFYAQRFQDFFANVVFRKIPSLNQSQILSGTHVRRFRNFVHMAMRQNPDRKPSSARRDASDKGKSAAPVSLSANSAELNDSRSKTADVESAGVTRLSDKLLAHPDDRATNHGGPRH